MLALPVGLLGGCGPFPGVAWPGSSSQELVLSNEPAVLGPTPIRFSAAEPMTVIGMTSEICVVLAEGLPADADVDAEYERLRGRTRLTALLHGSDGTEHVWTCGGWSFGNFEDGKGQLSDCLRWECHEFPPKGANIVSIDLSSDQPLPILGAVWQSTSAFDHVAQPPVDRMAVASAEYRQLARAFASQPPGTSPARSVSRVSLKKVQSRLSSDYMGTLSLRVTGEGLQLEPGPQAIAMPVVTIPPSAVEACSMSCWSRQARETNLLLSGLGLEVSFLNSPEVNEWCWEQRIPMATSASRRAWLYEGTALPPKDSYVAQFESRAAYDRQAQQSCMGY